MIYHIAAMLAGFLMDLLLGDPYWLPHPIRLIGNWISFLEKRLLGSKTEEKHTTPEQEQRRGMLLVLAVLSSTVFVTAVLLLGAYRLHPYLGVVIESIMTYQILATKCLKVESMKVYQELKKGDIAASRKAVSMIVGRDTECLDETGVAKAAIETVAENTSDGVIAPMIFTAIGGPILGFFYKAVNTMDSMVGYKNDRYLYFGRTAAKLDDIVNYIPARISASTPPPISSQRLWPANPCFGWAEFNRLRRASCALSGVCVMVCPLLRASANRRPGLCRV